MKTDPVIAIPLQLLKRMVARTRRAGLWQGALAGFLIGCAFALYSVRQAAEDDAGEDEGEGFRIPFTDCGDPSCPGCHARRAKQ